MRQKSGDTEILYETWSFRHKDIYFLQDTAKSAKNNTSDWEADWKNRVFWHCLIKLCCFSHQDCQQKAKHIASIQFSLQPDTKWHSFFASSLCYVPFHLAYQPPRQGTVMRWACTRAALPQGPGELCCCPQPVRLGARGAPQQGQGHYVSVLQAGKFSPGKGPQHWAMKAPAAVVCVFRPLWQRESTSQPGFAQQLSLPAQARHFQGKEIHPGLLAAFPKHPVNHFAVFKSKKWNEMKAKGLPWLCH